MFQINPGPLLIMDIFVVSILSHYPQCFRKHLGRWSPYACGHPSVVICAMDPVLAATASLDWTF